MSAGGICPECAAELPLDSAAGLCLRCLGRLAFQADPAPGGGGAGLRVGDYELVEEIARGGMGVVYRARQVSLNRTVALKVLLHGPFTSPDFVRRFRHEAQAVAALRHPNIVAIYEVGESAGTHFLSLEFVEGRNLADLTRTGPVPGLGAARYMKTVAEAIEHAHQRGVLHRDLKPSNILLDIFDQPRVTDFGLAKVAGIEEGVTVAGQILGSPAYMPPELALGDGAPARPTSDVYSLGAVLYELMTGRPPFQGETASSVLMQVRETEPISPRRLNPGAPLDLQTIALKCLKKDPARRYPTAASLAEDLGRFLDGKPILARPVGSLERFWLRCRRRPLISAMTAGLILSVILGLTGTTWEWRKAEFHVKGEASARRLAVSEAAETRLSLYAADVAVASQAVNIGNFGLARRTLQDLRPKRGETDLRGFEWRYLWGLCHGDQLATLTGHEHTVTATAFSPDGNWLATAGMDGKVKIWSTARRELLMTLNVSTNAVWSVDFTPEGRSLVTGYESRVDLWDLATWQRQRSFTGELAAVAKTGFLLATADSSPFPWGRAGKVALWDLRTGKLIREVGQPGRAIALSPDGLLLAVAGADSGLAVWSTTDGALVHQWPGKRPVWSLAFSPDGKTLASSTWASDVCLWSMAGDAPPRTLANPPFHVWAVLFSPDGASLITTSSDQTIRTWDADTLEPSAVLHGHNNEVWCAAFSPDGKLLATGSKDRTAMLWPAAAARPEGELPHHGNNRPIFSRDGKWLVTAGPHFGDYSLWSTTDRTLLAQSHGEGTLVIGFSADSQLLASYNFTEGSLKYSDPRTAATVSTVKLAGPRSDTQTQSRLGLGLSPDAALVFVSDVHGALRIWNATNGVLVATLEGPAPPLRDIVLGPGGRQLAVCDEREEAAWLFDCTTGRKRALKGHKDFVSGLDFSPDGATLATGSVDGTIRLWDTATAQCSGSLPGHLCETTAVAFSPDGRTLASLAQNESLKFWHLPTMREVVSQPLPHGYLFLGFSPDGSSLAVETAEDRLRLLTAPAEDAAVPAGR